MRRGVVVALIAAAGCGRIGFEPGADDDGLGVDGGTGTPVGTEIAGEFVLSDRSTYQAHGSSHSFPHSVSPGEDRILLVGASVESSTRFTESMTFGDQPLTKITSIFAVGGGLDCEASLWYLVNPPVGTHTLRVATQATKDLVGVALTISGVDQEAPIGAFDQIAGESNATSLSLAPEADELVIDMLCQGDGGNLVVGPDQIEQGRVDHNSSTFRSAVSTESGNGVMSWSFTGNPAHAQVAALLDPSDR